MDFGSDDPDCLCPDYDRDGYACTDCNDFFPAMNPGIAEIGCDLIDNDCDAATPDMLDADTDGYACDVDCGTSTAAINPGARSSTATSSTTTATRHDADVVDEDARHVTTA